MDIDKELSEEEAHQLVENDPLIQFARKQKPAYEKEKRKAKNKKPEAKFQSEILRYFREEGFFMERYESAWSKSRYSSSDHYVPSGCKKGTPDTLGCDKHGNFIAVELKAPGKRSASTLREDQRAFLMKVIRHNGFGAVVDSIDLFNATYYKWISIEDKSKRQEFLIESLP